MGGEINYKQAKQICQQALPYSVVQNMEVKDIIPCANGILMVSSAMIQRMQMSDFDMHISVKWKGIKEQDDKNNRQPPYKENGFITSCWGCTDCRACLTNGKCEKK